MSKSLIGLTKVRLKNSFESEFYFLSFFHYKIKLNLLKFLSFEYLSEIVKTFAVVK